jgi:hypothetical protein
MSTITIASGSRPSFDDEYALFSSEGKRLRSEVFIVTSPPWSLEPEARKSIEMRQQPFVAWLRQIEALAALPSNWDSYEARVISRAAVEVARALLTDLSFQALPLAGLLPFHIAPIPTGGIEIEWRRADGAGSLELWIDSGGAMEAITDRPFAEPRFQSRELSGLAVAISEITSFAS